MLASNRLFIGDHYSVYTGYLPDVPHHQHTTGAVCISLGEPFSIRTDIQREVRKTRSAFVPQNLEIEIQTYDQPVMFFCFEVESHFYQRLMDQFDYPLDCATCDLSNERDLIDASLNLLKAEHYDTSNTFVLCKLLVPELDSPKDIGDMDDRVIRIIRAIEKNIEINHELEELAKLVSLSTGRVTHLFREETGISIRRFRIWKRLQNLLRLYLRGQSMTDAAIASGFSDSSHFSNSCRKLLGLSPTELLKPDQSIQLFVDGR